MNELSVRIIVGLILVPLVTSFFAIGGIFLNIFLILISILMAFEWRNLTHSASNQIKWQLGGVIYIMLPIISILFLNHLENSLSYILFIALQVILTDISAYFGGKSFKGKKLAPSISPGKTWSGLIVAIISNIVFCYLAYEKNFLGVVDLYQKPSLFYFLCLGSINPVLAQLGDLLESKVKRIFKVKDSGKLLLAHGGILDRLDGFALTLPFNSIVIFCLLGY